MIKLTTVNGSALYVRPSTIDFEEGYYSVFPRHLETSSRNSPRDFEENGACTS